MTSPMTPTEQAARWLADVPRYFTSAILAAVKHGVELQSDEGGDWMQRDDVLAAIARHLAPGDELVERLLDWPYQGETMAHEAAAHISALTATVEAYRESHLHADSLRLKAEAETATLRDRLARMEGALQEIDRKSKTTGYAKAALGYTARAALTDGGSNG